MLSKLENFSIIKFKLFLFDETTLLQKISLSIMHAKEITEKNKRGHMTNPPELNSLINTNLLSNL